MSKSSSSTSSGVGLSGLIFVVFLVLKLAEIGAVAKWSWLWVTAPLWIPAGLCLIFIAFCLIMHLIQKLTK